MPEVSTVRNCKTLTMGSIPIVASKTSDLPQNSAVNRLWVVSPWNTPR